MIKKAAATFLIVILLLQILTPAASALSYTPPFELYSQTVLLINLDTDTVVYEKNADSQVFPASLTKIVTCALALRDYPDLDKVVTVQEDVFDDLGYDYSNARPKLEIGEQLTMRQLLYALMLNSACEGANVIAEEVAGSISGFVDRMNEYVKELGCTGTRFQNPHGLHESGHYTTARDLAIIVRAAMEVPGFMEICSTFTYSMPATNMTEGRTFSNSNILMDENQGGPYYHSAVRGIKTGYTDEGGRCLITTATQDGYTYLLITLGAPVVDDGGNDIDDKLHIIDAYNIYEWVFPEFEVRSMVDIRQAVGEVKVSLGSEKDSILVYPASDLSALLSINENLENVELIPALPESVEAPVQKGTELGTARVMFAGEELGQVKLIAGESVTRSEWQYYLQKIENVFQSTFFKIVAIFLLIIFVLYIIFALLANQHRKNKRVSNRRQK